MSHDEYGGEREKYEGTVWLVLQQDPNEEELDANKRSAMCIEGGLEEMRRC